MSQHPNLLIVFPDQMRGSALGFLGEEPVQTPHLDAFAAEALTLDQACATYPLCSPFRAMLMTGKYPHGNGVLGNCNSLWSPRGQELNREETCWSDLLREEGYELGYIGKWHLDAPHEPFVDCSNNHGPVKWNEWCPPERRHGFEHWYAYGTYDEHLRPLYWNREANRDQFHYVNQWGPEHEADQAIRFIKNEGGSLRAEEKPFALVVAMNPPHTPYEQVPEHYGKHYNALGDDILCRRPNIPPAGTEWGDHYRQHIRNYYAMISGVDAQFGRILKALEEAGRSEDTLVVFLSDHGDCLGIHGEVTKNNAYEESLRIPLMLRWPGRIAPGRDDLLISAPDLYPTLLGLMGLRDSIPPAVDGSDFSAILMGGQGRRPTSQLYFRIPPDQPESGIRGLRTRTHTFLVERNGSDERVRLFNRESDPWQLRECSEDEPEVISQLRSELNEWLARTEDPWQIVSG